MFQQMPSSKQTVSCCLKQPIHRPSQEDVSLHIVLQDERVKHELYNHALIEGQYKEITLDLSAYAEQDVSLSLKQRVLKAVIPACISCEPVVRTPNPIPKQFCFF